MRDAMGSVRSVLVLGGTSEIGLAIARRQVADRCRTVVLAARDPEACAAGAEELRRAGAEVHVLAYDVLDTAAHAAVLDEARALAGDLDLVVHAAGVLGDQEALEADPALALDVIGVNYSGAVTTLLEAARVLREQGQGTIVVLSSVAGQRARRDNFVYGSTKAGLDAFAQGLGDAVVGTGVRVVVVRPGFVHTRMTAGMEAAPFSTTPEAVAEAVAVGLQRNQEVVWAPAVLRWLFAVLRLLPRPVWRIVSAR